MTTIKPLVSYGGFNLQQDGISAALDSSHSQPGKVIEILDGTNRIAAIRPRLYKLPPLSIQLLPDDNDELEELRVAVTTAFDTPDESRALVRVGADGNEQYIMAACEDFIPADKRGGLEYVALLTVDGQQYWRSVTQEQETWEISDSGDTTEIVVDGNLDVYPVYSVTPNAAKSGGGTVNKKTALYSWRHPIAYEQCPIRFSMDVEGMVASEEISGGENIAVYVDGKETRRWITDDGIWINLDLAPGLTGSLSGYDNSPGTEISTGAALDTLLMSSDLADWPSSGLVRIGDELFTYANIDRAKKRLLGVTRSALSTSSGAHAVGASAFWYQHVVEIYYGSGVTAATDFPDDVYTNGEIMAYDARKPCLNLSQSTNLKWVWDDEFGQNRVDVDEQEPRAARWAADPGGRNHIFSYTPGGDPPNLPYESVIVSCELRDRSGPEEALPFVSLHIEPRGWVVRLPNRVSSIDYDAFNVTPWDETYMPRQSWTGQIISRIGDFKKTLVAFDKPSSTDPYGEFGDFLYGKQAADTGVAVSDTPAGSTLSVVLASYLPSWTRLDSLTVYFPIGFTTSLGNETEGYVLNATLNNLTTGEGVSVQLPMELDETLTIDTENHTVVYTKGEPNQYQAVRRDGVRLPVLRLATGSNTLEFNDAGTTDVTISIAYRPRWY